MPLGVSPARIEKGWSSSFSLSRGECGGGIEFPQVNIL
jgi:hypothetical protein